MGKGSKRRPTDRETFSSNYDRIFNENYERIFPKPDSENPHAMECPYCAGIALVPEGELHPDGVDSHRDWHCEHCNMEVTFP